ncbi:MAG: M15 family metallopeptidase [Prosthecobacter sp.]|uniref:M15 family metallopeptidase n=1 Tax=Prosthecobacter sp. TaxID=1965333 RepID=UPI0039026E94
MSITDIIKEVQTALKIEADGAAGPQTWGAIHQRIVGGKTNASAAKAPVPTMGTVDSRSETSIATLQLDVHPHARALVQRAAAAGITIKIISGTRTFAEQDALYAKGRTAPGNKVTNAKGGFSNHNFGIAFDIGVFEGTTYKGESPKYKAVGAIGVDLGLEWGGNWKTIVDEPHFQLRPAWAAGLAERDMLAELRRRKEVGKPVFA